MHFNHLSHTLSYPLIHDFLIGPPAWLGVAALLGLALDNTNVTIYDMCNNKNIIAVIVVICCTKFHL